MGRLRQAPNVCFCFCHPDRHDDDVIFHINEGSDRTRDNESCTENHMENEFPNAPKTIEKEEEEILNISFLTTASSSKFDCSHDLPASDVNITAAEFISTKITPAASISELCTVYPAVEGEGESSECQREKLSLDCYKQRDVICANSDDSVSSDKAYCSQLELSHIGKLNENGPQSNFSKIECKHSGKTIESDNEIKFNGDNPIKKSELCTNPVPSTSSCHSQADCANYCINYGCVDDPMHNFLLKPASNSNVATQPARTMCSKMLPNLSLQDESHVKIEERSRALAPSIGLISSNVHDGKLPKPRQETVVSSHCYMGNVDLSNGILSDCDEQTSDEEICTCHNFSNVASNCKEIELVANSINSPAYKQSAKVPENLSFQNNFNNHSMYQRKRKHKENQVNELGIKDLNASTILRKRMALNVIPSSMTFSVQTDSPIASERRSRSLIPTKDNPPPELESWILQFQRWSHVERLLAIDKLIEHSEPTQVRHMMKVIEPQFQRDFISLLPRELALQVLSYLDPKDLLRAAQTCRSWRFLCDDNLLWKEKCKQAQIQAEPNSDKPKRGRAGTMPATSSPWKAAFIRQYIIEMNWRSRPIREPKILKGHDDHVITCLQFHGNRIVSGSDDNTLKVWSAITGKCLRTLLGHTGGVWSSQMAGNIIISGSTDRTLKVWNMDSGQCIHTLQGHTSTVRCMHLHGKRVVSGSRDATLRVWDIESGTCLHVLVGHLAAVRCVQYDGKLIVSGAYDYMVKVWNPEKQECLHTLQGHTNRVYSLQFDGIHIVSGSLDTSIRVWDAETGNCKHTLMGHQSLTSGMELRQNILVSGNADSTVKVWDITSGQCLQTLSGPNKHQSAVTCLQFNSRFVITSSDDGTVKLWDVNTGEFIRNLVSLDSGGSGGVVWRIRANETKLVCAVGSRNGTEETKLMVLDFDVDGACAKCS